MRPFPVIATTGEPRAVLERLVDALVTTFTSLKSAVTNEKTGTVALSATDTRVYHGLGEIPTAWEVIGLDSGEVVYESTTPNNAKQQYLILKATGPCVAKIRFS
jgi:hypothetical protein